MSLLDKIRNSHDLIFKGFLTVLCIVCIVLIFPKEARFKYEFTQGRPWLQEELIAPFSFSILKTDDELATEEDALREQHRPFFDVKAGISLAQRDAVAQRLRDTWTESGPGQPGFVGRLFGGGGKVDTVALEAHIAVGQRLMDAIYKKGIIELADPIEGKAGDYEITTLNGRVEEERPLSSFYRRPQALDYLDLQLPDEREDVAASYLRDELADLLLPDVVYNATMTEGRLQQSWMP